MHGKNVGRTFSSLRNATIALLFRSSLTTSVVSITATKSATKSVLHVESFLSFFFFLLIKPVAFYFLVSIVLSFFLLANNCHGERKMRGKREASAGPRLAFP